MQPNRPSDMANLGKFLVSYLSWRFPLLARMCRDRGFAALVVVFSITAFLSQPLTVSWILLRSRLGLAFLALGLSYLFVRKIFFFVPFIFSYVVFFPRVQIFCTFLFTFILGLLYQIRPFSSYSSFRPSSSLRAFGFFLSFPLCFNLFYFSAGFLVPSSLCIFSFLSFFYFFILYETFGDGGNSAYFVPGFEVVVLILLSCLGSIFLITVDDLFLFYLSLELQTLPLYVLVYYVARQRFVSSERGLKYFVLGSISSGISLFGVTLFYGFFGSTSFEVIAFITCSLDRLPGSYLYLPLTLLLGGVFFKILAFPFHIWRPQVYGASSYAILIFIGVLSKIPLFVFFWNFFLLFSFFSNLHDFMFFIGSSTLFFGTFGALFQPSAKQFLAYASMSHTAFLIASLCSSSLGSFFFYLFFYSITSFRVFCVFLSLVRWSSGQELNFLRQLRWIFSSNPSLVLCFSVLFLSLGGIPPFWGFFAKFYVLRSIFSQGYWFFSFFFLLLSLFSLYYYLRIIQNSRLAFDKRSTLFQPMPYSIALFIVITFFVTLLFPFFGDWFLSLADSFPKLSPVLLKRLD